MQASLNGVLLDGLAGQLYRLLLAADFPGLQALFTAFFTSIPHDWYRNSPIAQYGGYYASIFYSQSAARGLDVRLEAVTSQGCIDMTLLFNGQVFIFEFKLVELVPEGRALEQIRQRGYAGKYCSRDEPIHLVAAARRAAWWL